MAQYKIGTRLCGRYVLLELLAHGGVSVVYKAQDTQRSQRIAMKLLDPTRAGDEDARERIRREGIITERVRHPSVPKVYDFGEAPLDDGTVVPYIAMQLICGDLLAEHFTHGAMPWPDAVRVVATIADVLAVTHRRGVVHRDVNETNIVMADDGPKLIDFGTAVTVPGPSWGAPTFVAPKRRPPENDFAGPGEPADDVYALGVLLYQLLTGRSPYPNGSRPPATSARERAWLAPTPVLTVPGLPQGVAEICRRCMAKRAVDRPDAAATAIGLWTTIAHTPAALYHPGHVPAPCPRLWPDLPLAPASAPPVPASSASWVRQVAPGRWIAHRRSEGQTVAEVPTVDLRDRGCRPSPASTA